MSSLFSSHVAVLPFGSRPVSVHAQVAERERLGLLPLGELLPEARLDQRAQRRVVLGGGALRFRKQRIRDLDRRLHVATHITIRQASLSRA